MDAPVPCPGAALAARLADGELALFADGAPVVERVFVAPEEGPFLLAGWRVVASTARVGPDPARAARDLLDALRAVARTADPALVAQVVALADDLAATEATSPARRRRRTGACSTFTR